MTQPSPTPSQLQELAAARDRFRPIRRAILTAQIDGWSLAVFAALTLICGLFSVSGVVMGLALGAIAFVELTSIPRLRRLEPAAARTLGFNQLALAALLIAYALYNLLFPDPLPADVQAYTAELEAAGMDIASLERQLRAVVYVALIAVAVLAQGSLAWFYFRREKLIRDFAAATPAWVLAVHQAGS